jgi:Mg2+ and Co2+ transporter CorA
MPEDADLAQARMLMSLLDSEIDEISDKIEAAERRARLRHLYGHGQLVRSIAQLRRQLYEAHRLVDGLHRRFPATID